ncbi:hypothetical protein NA57DRAFT_73872 [Rhizodiscina lignyota]|uniref:Mid2 domain-containing protein n=1 Tax=Rhizodiscina lignyota TaxID=1504668 RepID=A0A9P4ILC8_9PEZI|nr:hypothetical protein NA57DRAFT_73872 [Rhizodiscina lignyota]
MRFHIPSLLIFFSSLYFATANNQNYFFDVGVHRNGNGSNQWNSNPVWAVGSTQKLQWRTTIANYSLFLWQQLPNVNAAQHSKSSIYTKQQGEAELGEFMWQVTPYELNLDLSSVFYVSLGSADVVDFNSGYFNISKASSTSSIDAYGTQLPASSDTSSTTQPPASSSATTTALSGGSSDLKIGLGVGLGLGISLVLAAGAFVVWCLKRRKAAPESVKPEKKEVDGVDFGYSERIQHAELSADSGLQELSDERSERVYEAPGDEQGHGNGRMS